MRRFKAELEDSILSYVGSTSVLNKTLVEFYRRDIRIIMGFFGAREARMVLCEVGAHVLITLVHKFTKIIRLRIHQRNTV